MGSHSQFLYMLLLIFIFRISLFAEYYEGIDTTYSNGYGLDGAFRVENNSIWAVNKLLFFHFDFVSLRVGEWYFFNYTFDEIKKVPLLPSEKWVDEYACVTPLNKPFIVKMINSTYSKVEIINQIASGEYVFKYGLNDETSNLILAPNDYNKDSLYKPNNLIFLITDIVKQTKPFVSDIEWELPLENNNELFGYNIYKIDKNNIDTSKEIDLNNWKLEEFTTKNYSWNGSYVVNIERNVYWNIVAVYKNTNGDTLHSKPLKGWTLFPDWASNINSASQKTSNTISIFSDHLDNQISFSTAKHNHITLKVFDMKGRLTSTLVDSFKQAGKHTVNWDSNRFGAGNYFIKLSANGSSFSKKIMVVK